jgi:hypothetical protein
MSIDPPRSHTPEPELDPLGFTTVPTELDDEEASSSFKELLDWMRYLAQHQGQRERLLDLLGAARDSLSGLMGQTVDPGHRATYASVATPATQPSRPRQAQTASRASLAKPNKKQVQHAITRFERVSRELPGAPRNTLLNIVSRSDLRNAPPPASSRPAAT